MKTLTNLKTRLVLILLSIIIFSTAFVTDNGGMAASKKPVKLVYKQAVGKTISYTSSTSITQSMDINGQTVNNYVKNDLGFKVKMIEKQGVNLKLEITIDSLGMKIETMQGSAGSKMKDVEGKSFNMVISPFGKVMDISEAEKIEYKVEGQGDANLSQTFVNIFPDLPEKAVKPGATWTKNDTITTKSAASKTKQSIQSVYKFEGYEIIDGINCAKVTSTVTGTMETNTQNMGMDIYISGPLQGEVVLYFAVKEGYFLKQEVKSKMTGTVEISGAQSMTFPITMDSANKMEAKK
jgi:hypothetical protein